jgi:hypothetical protein
MCIFVFFLALMSQEKPVWMSGPYWTGITNQSEHMIL